MGSVMAGVAILLLVFAFGLVRPEGENALGRALGGESTAAGSNAIREDLGSRVLDRWEQRPITGNGYNYMRPSHNVYLGLLGSAGLLGIVGYGLVITTIARRTWRQRSDLLAVCLAAGYASYLAVAYFDNIFWWRWLWFYIGLVVAALATRPAPGEPGYEPGSEAGAELATASTR
jgi:O-antigen ligase